MEGTKNDSTVSQNMAWRLGDNVDVIEAQFQLGDFCLNHFPENPEFARTIQNADSIQGVRNAIKPVTQLIITKRKDLTDAFASLVHAINQTKA